MACPSEVGPARSRTTYGCRLISHVIDEIASTDPLRECFQMPKTPSTGLTWTIVIFERFANAINRCSHKVINKVGEPAGGFPTICYVGPNNACYLVSQSTNSLSLIAALTIYRSSWWRPSRQATRSVHMQSCPKATLTSAGSLRVPSKLGSRTAPSA